MDPAPLLDRVLDDEGLTAGLDEPEAILLVRTLSDRVRAVAAGTNDPELARRRTEDLCRHARHAARAAAAAPPGEAGRVLGRLLDEWPESPE